MIRYRRWILLLIPAFLLLVIPVFAASIDFLPKAQRYIDRSCSERHISTQTSLLCYLFFKAGEQDQRLITRETQGATMSAAIAGLQDKPLPPPLIIEGSVYYNPPPRQWL